jgi:RHS repeat-associated protein
MHARYHSPHLGHFFSPEPGDSASLPNPQSWNKYGYVRSNPLKYIDPNG